MTCSLWDVIYPGIYVTVMVLCIIWRQCGQSSFITLYIKQAGVLISRDAGPLGMSLIPYKGEYYWDIVGVGKTEKMSCDRHLLGAYGPAEVLLMCNKGWIMLPRLWKWQQGLPACHIKQSSPFFWLGQPINHRRLQPFALSPAYWVPQPHCTDECNRCRSSLVSSGEQNPEKKLYNIQRRV